ncbi:MAG: hypothetical protein Q4G19_04350 [Clostridia bacterium]|nr:hypothetical protein [Clostridia bacterium]
MRFIRKGAEAVSRFCVYLFPAAIIACLFRTYLSLLSPHVLGLESFRLSLNSALMHICYVPLTISVIAGWLLQPKRLLYQLPVLAFLLYVRDHFYFTGDQMFDLFLFAFASVNAGRKSAIRTAAAAWAALAVLTAVLYCTGQTNNVVRVFTYGTGYSFGFSHPNTTGAAALALVLVLWAAFFRGKHVITFIVSWSAAAVTYLIFASRTPAVMLILFPIADLLLEALSRKSEKLLPRAMAILPVCYCLVSVLLVVIAIESPGLLSGNLMARFTYAAKAIKQCGITFFGNPTVIYECEGIVLDNQYLNWIIYRGVIPAVLGLALEVYMMYRFAKNKDHTGLVWAFIMITAGLMENVYTWPLFFPAPMILFAAVSGTAKKERLPS